MLLPIVRGILIYLTVPASFTSLDRHRQPCSMNIRGIDWRETQANNENVFHSMHSQVARVGLISAMVSCPRRSAGPQRSIPAPSGCHEGAGFDNPSNACI